MVKSARDVGFYIHFDLLKRTHVQRTVYGTLPLPCNTSTPADSALGVDWHFTTTDANTSRFRQQRAGRSSGLLGQPTPVGAECSCRCLQGHRRQVALCSRTLPDRQIRLSQDMNTQFSYTNSVKISSHASR